MTNERIERAETRRHFLGIAAASAAAAVAGRHVASAAIADANDKSTDFPAPWSDQHHRATVTALGEHLLVYHGPINVGIVRDGTRALLIDCGDGSVAGGAAGAGHHVDRAGRLHAPSSRPGVRRSRLGRRRSPASACPPPSATTSTRWRPIGPDPKSRWHIYNQHPHHLMLAEPVRVDAALRRWPADRHGARRRSACSPRPAIPTAR